MPSPPPPPPCIATPPPPPPPMSAVNGCSTPSTTINDRSALLGSICNFNKSTLRKTTPISNR